MNWYDIKNISDFPSKYRFAKFHTIISNQDNIFQSLLLQLFLLISPFSYFIHFLADISLSMKILKRNLR